MAFRSEEDGYFAGAVRFKAAILNDGAISDDQVASGADLAASKLKHVHRATYGQAIAASPTTGAYTIHAVKGATAGVLEFKTCLATAPTGDGSVTVDCLNGTASLLSAAVTLNSSSTAYTFQAGTVSTSAATVGDVIVISITKSTGTAGTCGSGLMAYADLVEDYD